MLPVSTHSAFCLSCRRLFRTSYGLTPNIWWVFHLETRLLSPLPYQPESRTDCDFSNAIAASRYHVCSSHFPNASLRCCGVCRNHRSNSIRSPNLPGARTTITTTSRHKPNLHVAFIKQGLGVPESPKGEYDRERPHLSKRHDRRLPQ